MGTLFSAVVSASEGKISRTENEMEVLACCFLQPAICKGKRTSYICTKMSSVGSLNIEPWEDSERDEDKSDRK